MRYSLAILLVLCVGMAACGTPWHGSDKKAEPAPMSTPEIPATASDASSKVDEPCKVVLMDSMTQRDLWVIETTRGHVTLLPDIGRVKVDGQMWEGPYRIVKR